MRKRAVIYSLVVALSAAALGLAACSSGPRVTSNYDKSADFARYRTYGFVAQPNTQRLGYSSLITQQVEAAVTQQMEQRGYTHADNPDLLVNFSGKMQQRQELQSTPGPGYGYRGYYGYRAGMYGVWSGYPSVYTVNYSEGTLNIDIVDASRKQMVWEGVGVGELTKDKLKNPQATVHETVAAMFQDYPFRAGQSGPIASAQ